MGMGRFTSCATISFVRIHKSLVTVGTERVAHFLTCTLASRLFIIAAPGQRGRWKAELRDY